MVNNTASDRLVFTLVISIIIHLIILLGVSFNVFSPPTNAPINNLEITLVKHRENTKPDKADYLAQVDNEGGGELETPSPTPSEDLPTPVIEEEPAAEAITPLPIAKADPQTMPAPVAKVEPTPEPQPEQTPVKVESKKPVKPAPQPPKEKTTEKMVKAITQAKSEKKITKVEKAGEATQPETVKTDPQPKLSARDLMLQAHNEIEHLQDKLDKTTKSLSSRPKKRRISASTKEYAAAAYMKAWEMKVERIGNMNYPQEAKRLGLSGSLMLSVDINPDGSVPPGGIVISRSSGYKVLDDAAVKIVRQGAPYAAIPENVLKTNDMLTIIRTWKFETNRGLSTR